MPNRTLSQAFLLQLKTSDPKSLDQLGFLQKIFTSLKYAELSEKEQNVVEWQLLQDIDQVAQRIFTAIVASQGTAVSLESTMEYHWSSAISGGRANSTFLTFAVRFGLHSFVTWSLDQIDIGSQELSAMLQAGLIDLDNMPYLGCYSLQRQGIENIDLLVMLLKRGANPYEMFHGCSVYELARARRDETLLRSIDLYGPKSRQPTSANTISEQDTYDNWSFKDHLVLRKKSNPSIDGLVLRHDDNLHSPQTLFLPRPLIARQSSETECSVPDLQSETGKTKWKSLKDNMRVMFHRRTK
jgi:hypothetical protein